MNISQVYAVYFSATGNTRKVTTTLANALAVSFDVPLEVRDFTLPAAREESYEFAAGDLVVFGMPTYAGKLPNKLLDFVKSGFHGNGALAVPVVTFGNRSFDNSLAELCACLEGDGFHTIGAGAFEGLKKLTVLCDASLIPEGSFADCVSLADVRLSAGATDAQIAD